MSQNDNSFNLQSSITDQMNLLFEDVNKISNNIDEYVNDSQQQVKVDLNRLSFKQQKSHEQINLIDPSQDNQLIDNLLQKNQNFQKGIEHSIKDIQSQFSFHHVNTKSDLKNNFVPLDYSVNSKTNRQEADLSQFTNSNAQIENDKDKNEDSLEKFYTNLSKQQQEYIEQQEQEMNQSQDDYLLMSKQRNQFNNDTIDNQMNNLQETEDNESPQQTYLLDTSKSYKTVQETFTELENFKAKSIFQMTNLELQKYHNKMYQKIKKKLLNRQLIIMDKLLQKQGRNWIGNYNKNNQTVMSYNILARSNMNNMFPYHHQEILKRSNRFKIMTQEILEINPDLLFLQEVEEDQKEEFKEILGQIQMKYFFQKKTDKKKIEGSLIGYNSKYEFINYFYIDCLFDKQDNVFTQAMYKGIVPQFLILKNIKTQQMIMTVNIHLPYNVNRGHLKFSILILIFKGINLLKQKYQIDNVIFGGDFNIIPNSMLYDFIINNKIDFDIDLINYSNQKFCKYLKENNSYEQKLKKQNAQFKYQKNMKKPKLIDIKLLNILHNIKLEIEYNQLVINNIEITQYQSQQFYEQYFMQLSKDLNFKSSTSPEPFVTHCTLQQSVCCDFLFISSNNIKVESNLQLPDSKQFNQKMHLPFIDHPSDHMPISFQFSFNQFNYQYEQFFKQIQIYLNFKENQKNLLGYSCTFQYFQQNSFFLKVLEKEFEKYSF